MRIRSFVVALAVFVATVLLLNVAGALLTASTSATQASSPSGGTGSLVNEIHSTEGQRALIEPLTGVSHSGQDGLVVPHAEFLSSGAWLSSIGQENRIPRFTPLILEGAEGTPGVSGPVQSWDFNVPVGFEGVLFPHNEPAIAVSALDSNNLVAIYHDYEAASLTDFTEFVVTKFSLDGGLTWSTRFSHPTLVPFGQSFDPAIAADAEGNFYAAYLVLDFEVGTSNLVVGKSTDGGATWEHSIARAGEPFFEFLDKDFIAVDPVTGILYGTYSNFYEDFVSIEVVRSTDGGASWEPPIVLETVRITEIPEIRLIQGAYPAARNGVVMVAYYDSLDDGWLLGDFGLKVAVSNDGGATYSPSVLAGILPGEMPFWLPSRAISLFHPRIWATMAPIPAIGPEGNLYMVATAAGDNTGDTFFLRSADGGLSWSPPTIISDDPFGRAQFFPWIAVQEDGTIHVMFGDRRDDPDDTFYDIFYTHSTDGGTTFSANVPITDTPNTPSWYFIGDYFGLAASPAAAHAIWTDNRIMDNWGDTFTVRGDKVLSAPAIRAIPSRAEFGELVVVLGSGFAPQSEVTVFIEAEIVATARTDDAGGLIAQFEVPDRMAGRYPLSVVDSEGNAALRFFIVKPSLFVDPAEVEIGGTFVVSGTRYKPNIPIILYLGEQFLTDAFTDDTGRFDTRAFIESGPGGERTLSAIPLSPFWVYDDFDFETVTVVLPPGWTPKAPLPEPREGAAGAVVGDEIYVMHGFTPQFGDTKDVRVYDTATDSWSVGPQGLDPLSSEHYQGVTVLREGLERAYLIGGRSFEVLSENREFTPATGTWEYRAPMPTPRAGAAVAAVNNLIYVIGGRDCTSPFCGTPLDAVEIYDPVTDTWSKGTPMPTPRSGASATSLGDFIVVTGGWAREFEATNVVELYDPVANSWSKAPPMPTARAYHGSAICNGWVAAVGGIEKDFSFSSAFEIFNPVLGWQIGTVLPTPRGELVVITHRDAGTGTETLYTIGGGLFGVSFDTVEAFDCSFLPPAPTPLTVVLEPAGGIVGSTFDIIGSGAEVGGVTILAFWDEQVPEKFLGDAITDDEGSFTISATVPEDVFGPHRVIVRDLEFTRLGSALFRVIPSLAVSPERAFVGDRVELRGTGYPAFANIVITLDDMAVKTALTDSFGSWGTTIRVPPVPRGIHLFVGTDPGTGVSAAAELVVREKVTLAVGIDTSPARVRGEVVRSFALVSLEGVPLSADSTTAKLYVPDGTVSSLLPVLLDEGLYAISFTVDRNAPLGDYALVFAAHVEQEFLVGSGVGLVSFQVLRLLPGPPSRIVSVDGSTATVQAEDRQVLLDLLMVNARIVSVEGTRVLVETDVGLLWADLEALNPRAIRLDGLGLSMETDLGLLRVYLTDLAFGSWVAQAALVGILLAGGLLAWQLVRPARRKPPSSRDQR